MVASFVERVRYELKRRVLTVQAVEQVNPFYVRITLTGDDLADFESVGVTDHVKLNFPSEGESVPYMPESTPPSPEERAKMILRDYTPLRPSQESRTVDIEFSLHGTGPASTWARQAKVGDQIGMLGPRGSRVVQPVFDWMLVIGDDSAIPSITRVFESFTAVPQITAIIEVGDASEEQWVGADNATVRWLHRDGSTDDMVTVAKAVELPEGEGYVLILGESGTVVDLRRFFMSERGMDPARVEMSGHWKRGIADWDHHDMPEA